MSKVNTRSAFQVTTQSGDIYPATPECCPQCCAQCCQNCNCYCQKKRHHGADDPGSSFSKRSRDTPVPEIQEKAGKIFSDPIHGHIELSPICIVVIDTPEFQRLRDLKQLGMGYFVYPAAAHNRFEHCLGVCHLARQFVEHLKNRQPELNINNKDILCVELAALCHDIGHGPFSHVFDRKVVPLLDGLTPAKRNSWKHESASQDIFEFIYKNNEKVRRAFDDHGISPEDIEFIKELIEEPTDPDEKTGDLQTWKYKGRGKEKAFLYEIVSNHRNEMDVDKWDYIARDCHQLGIRNSFDHTRVMKFARVIEGEDGRKQICLRDKELINLYSMFESRYLLHKMAYQHKVTCGLEIMVGQAIVKAQHDLRFDNCTIPDIIKTKYWEAYILMTDNILYKIRDANGDSENFKAAKKIVQRIFNRDFYRCVCESKPFKPEVWIGRKKGDPKESMTDKETRIKKEILKETNSAEFTEEDYFVQIVKLDFGMKEKSPLENMCVYSKEKPDVARKIRQDEMSQVLAQRTFTELMVRVYVSNIGKKDVIQKAYDKWEKINLLTEPEPSTTATSSRSANV